MHNALMFQNKWPSSISERPYLGCKTLLKRKTGNELSAIILKPEIHNISTRSYHFDESQTYENRQFHLSMLTLGWVYILWEKREKNEHLFNFIINKSFLNDIEGCTLIQWHFDSCSINSSLELCVGRCLLRQAYYGAKQFQPLRLLEYGCVMEKKKKTLTWAFPKLTLSKKIRQDTHIQLALKAKEWSFQNTETTLSLLHQPDATSSLQFVQKFSSNFSLSSANVYWSFIFPLIPFIKKCLITYKLKKHSCDISAQAILSSFHLKRLLVYPCFEIGTKQFSIFFFSASKNHHEKSTLFYSHQSKIQSPSISCGYHENYGIYLMHLIDCFRLFPKDWDIVWQCYLILHSKKNVLHITIESRFQYCESLYRLPLTFILRKTPSRSSTWLTTFPQQIIQRGKWIFFSLLSGIGIKEF